MLHMISTAVQVYFAQKCIMKMYFMCTEVHVYLTYSGHEDNQQHETCVFVHLFTKESQGYKYSEKMQLNKKENQSPFYIRE